MKKKKVIKITLVLIIIASVIGAITFNSFIDKVSSNLEQLADLEISNVDISSIPDGTYTGVYIATPIEAEVEVTLKNQKITSINLVKHDNGRGQAAEIIPENVVQAQTLEVDAISGATYSSKVILKAIENALQR